MLIQSQANTRMAVIYSRVSDPRQKTRGDGLRSQQARCKEFAELKNYQIAKIFEDDMTGNSLKRPDLNAMLVFLRKNRKASPVVIIDDITRFARDVVSHWTLRDKIKEAGGELVSPSMNFGESSGDILHENMMAVMAQHQRQKNAEQTQDRMRGRILNGYWTFAAPVGYRYERVQGHSKLLVRDEPIASIVEKALVGYASKRFVSQAEVQRFLEQQPAFPKVGNGTQVRPMTVTRMLNQFLYSGMVGHEAWGISMRKGHHEPLISFSTYQRIQDRLNENKYAARRKNTHKDFPLRGAVMCTDCGRHLTGSWAKGKYKHYAYYICQNKECRSYGKSIRKEQMEDDFGELLATITPTQELYELTSNMFTNIWEDLHHNRAKQKEGYKEERQTIQKTIDTMLMRIIDSDTLSVIKAYEEKIHLLEKRKLLIDEQIQSIANNKDTYRDNLELSMQFLRNPLNYWNSGDYERQRMTLKLTFAGHLSYCRKTGYRTPNLSLPFKLLEEIQNDKNTMVHLTRETSNSFIEELTAWNDHLIQLSTSDTLALPA